MPPIAKQQTNETLRADMWRACDTLCVHRDDNVGRVMQYTEHLAWDAWAGPQAAVWQNGARTWHFS